MVEKQRNPVRLYGAGRAAGISRISIASSRRDAHTFAFKGMIDCNWLQSLEVGIDPAHTSFLHRFFHDEEPKRRLRQAVPRQLDRFRHADDADHARVSAPAHRGRADRFRLASHRRCARSARKSTHVRVTNLMFPNAFIIPMSREMTITQWHVPIDDRRHYWYAIFTSFGAPVNKDEMRRQRLELYELPDYIPRKNKSNDYGFDPHEQEHETYTGMGADINVHDQWACELMGEIADRTQEHLGQSDKAIAAYRRLLRAAIDAIEKGERPPIMFDAAVGGEDDRAGGNRRYRSHRRLAGLLAEDRRRQARFRQLGQWALSFAEQGHVVT